MAMPNPVLLPPRGCVVGVFGQRERQPSHQGRTHQSVKLAREVHSILSSELHNAYKRVRLFYVKRQFPPAEHSGPDADSRGPTLR
jgi:hypothetical protein